MTKAESGTIVAALELTNVHLRRDSNTIIGAISVRVERDHRWIVLGPNGCGKSTLMRIMALYEHPTSGTVQVLGEQLGTTDVRTLRRRVGYAAAALSDQLRPELRAHDVVKTARFAALEPWWHHYDAQDDSRAVACLEQMGVRALAERTFGSLSSGEQQRVLLARTFMNDPGVILLDEPSARLDLRGREELVATLGDLTADPHAPPLVLITHHLDEVPTGITHAMLMQSGNVMTAGPIEQALTAENLSECFGLSLEVQRRRSGRFSAWARD